MKKIFTLIMLLVFCSPVLAETFQPLWSEFCPEKYLHPQEKINKEAERTAWSISDSFKRDLMFLTIINAPKIWKEDMELDKAVINNFKIRREAPVYEYWNNRKIAFDNEIATCNSDKNNQSLCYMQVRQLEQQKNDQLENVKLAERRSYHRAINNLSTQYQLNQMNANINNIKMQNQQMQFNNTLNTIKARGY
jgi:hypothetical protein